MYLADRLILFIDVIITGQQESTITTCSFTGAVVTTDNDEIQRVADTFQVVLLQLPQSTATVFPVFETDSIQ